MGYMCLFQFCFPLGICLGVGLMGHIMVLFLVFFLRNSILSSIMAVSISVKIDCFDILHNYGKELKICLSVTEELLSEKILKI